MANETKLQHLVDPQVMADMIESKLVDNMVYAPLCKIDNTLVGRPGSTVTLPKYGYIGDAEVVNELGEIPIKELSTSTQDVQIKKIGIGVKLSDESILSGFGDPRGEAVNQIITSIASKTDNEVLDALDSASLIHGVLQVDADEVNNALIKFGEDYEGEKYLFVSPATHAVLRKANEWIPASEIAAGAVLRGVVGQVYGCNVIISSKITTTNKAYIVKPGAVALFMKRGVLVETDRNIYNKFTGITADKHNATYLYDASKVIKLGAATLVTLTVAQTSDIETNAATFAITGYPTNLAYGWKAWYASNLDSALSVVVGDTFDNGSGKTHAAFSVEYSEDALAATNGKYSQVIYVDTQGKIRATGSVKAVTELA